jgi:hypothetical protein
MREHDPSDDLDRLFARLEAPPLASGYLDSVLAHAAMRRRRQVTRAVTGYGLLLTVIAASAFAFGRGLVAGGADGVLALAVLAPAAVGGAPREFLWALLESVPWGWLAALLVAGVALARCVGAVGLLLARPRPAPRKLEARHG